MAQAYRGHGIQGVWERFEQKRSGEFKFHLPNVLQLAKRRGAEKVILFMDHAPCHKIQNVMGFIHGHKLPRTRLLPKRALQLNPQDGS